MDNNSIILVFKIGSKDKSDSELVETLTSLREKVKQELEQGNLTVFFLPNSKSTDITIECINPKLVTIDSYKEAEQKLQYLQNYIDKSLNDIPR